MCSSLNMSINTERRKREREIKENETAGDE